ncbi:hypothetical protein EsH8_II_000220 [Colletotrichum jinshuiense]
MLPSFAFLLTLAAGAVAQREISCFCREQASQRIRVDWTSNACSGRGYMRGDACILVSDPTRNNDFQNRCLEENGLQTAECG